jgi:hypothetical protein
VVAGSRWNPCPHSLRRPDAPDGERSCWSGHSGLAARQTVKIRTRFGAKTRHGTDESPGGKKTTKHTSCQNTGPCGLVIRPNE